MPDPIEPTPPPISSANSEPSSLDLPPNVAAAIACIPLIGGIIFWVLEKRNRFVRFYAMQSIIFGIAWVLFNIVSAIVRAVFLAIPGIGGILFFFWSIVAALVHLAFLVIMIIAIVKAFTNVRWDIPYVGPIARKQVGEG
ncbi:MAG: hypothetical protein QOG48_2521 [Verrucomicrobiota bacterium]|jgi:uncharacterized membrane protein